MLMGWVQVHLKHPYPTSQEKQELASRTQLTREKVEQWFINGRRAGPGRLGVITLKQLEDGGTPRTAKGDPISVSIPVQPTAPTAFLSQSQSLPYGPCFPAAKRPAQDPSLLEPESKKIREEGEFSATQRYECMYICMPNIGVVGRILKLCHIVLYPFKCTSLRHYVQQCVPQDAQRNMCRKPGRQ